MQKFISTFLLISIFVLCGCGGGGIVSEISQDDKNIFQKDLTEIYDQQYYVRRAQWLNILQNESRNANTLSSLNELELMLENPDFDNIIKNQNLMQHFDRASLYMQILLFPYERENFLQTKIRNELLFELSSILLHCSIAETAINKLQQLPASTAAAELINSWQNIISNQKIEYDTLRINEFNAGAKMPEITYPTHLVPAFKSLDDYRKHQYTSARNAALAVYPQLAEKFGEKLPLTLLKLMYKAPYELNNHYSNNTELKKSFSYFLQELFWLWQSEQLWNNMQNSFTIAQDFQRSAADGKNISSEMIHGCYKSQLAYELAYLKMLSKIGISVFSPDKLPQDNIKQLQTSQFETLQLIFNEIMKKI